MDERPKDTYHFQEGAILTEMNTIFRRIQRRRDGEPTGAERARLAELRAELLELRKGRI